MDPEDITETQTLLVARGYDIQKTPDGILDEPTCDAIETYRIHHGLRVVRVIDDELLTSLADEAKVMPVSEPEAGPTLEERVTALEEAVP